MADISLTIKSNFEQASKDLKEFGNVTESTRQRIEKFTKEFKSEQIDNFVDRQNRAAAAIKATRGPMASLQSESRAYQREIERLIRSGLDPESEEVLKLKNRYIQLQQEIKDTTAAEGKHEKASALTAASMLYIAQTAINVGRQVFDIFSDLTTAAGDYVESVNAVNVVFEESSQRIIEFGETAKTSVGLSKTAFNELATVTGAQLKNAGISIDLLDDKVIELTQRAADTASVFNTDVNDALEAFNAVLRGQVLPARRYAISISDAAVQAEALASGLVKNKSEITDQIKIQARYNLIMKQSSDFAGDFANTQESFSNQLKIAKAAIADAKSELGEGLIPAATLGVSVFGKLAQKVADYAAELNGLRDARKADEAGTANAEQRILLLQKEKKELEDGIPIIRRRYLLNLAFEKLTENAREAKLAAISAEIRALSLQAQAEDYATEQEQKRAQAAAEAAREEAEKAQELADYLDLVAAEYAKTEQGKKEALAETIAMWEEYAKTAVNTAPQVQAILEMLNKQMEDLTKATDNYVTSSIKGFNRLADIERAEIEQRNKIRLEAQEKAIESAKGKRDYEVAYYIETTNAAVERERAEIEASNAVRMKTQENAEAKAKAEKDAAEDAAKVAAEAWDKHFDAISSGFMSVMSSIDSIIKSSYDNQIALLEAEKEARLSALEDEKNARLEGIDAALQKELEAAGVAEESTLERLNRELQEAFAAGDIETVKKLQDEIKRTEITEKYAAERAKAEIEENDKIKAAQLEAEKEIAEAEYKSAMAAWGFQIAEATAAAAVAVIKALPDPILATAAGVASAFQVAAVIAAQPQPPAFQTGTLPSGYTVPESTSSRQDPSYFRANPGEKVTVTPRGESGTGVMNAYFQLEGQTLISFINAKIGSGDIVISSDNVQRRAAG